MRTIHDLKQQLMEIRDQAMRKIAASTREGKVTAVIRQARLLEDCERALHQLADLEQTAIALEKQLASIDDEGLPPRRGPSPVSLLLDSPDVTSARGRGSAAREAWIQRLRDQDGIDLREIDKSRYETSDHRRVGVAYGMELSGKNGVWFLGLPNEKFDVVVLLCETKSAQLLDFIIPISDIREDWEEVARKGNDRQVKVNLKKVEGNYYLMLPAGAHRSLGGYLGNYEPLVGIR